MSELPSNPPDMNTDPFWNRKRIGLAVVSISLLVILILVVLLALTGPTICCQIFSNIMNTL